MRVLRQRQDAEDVAQEAFTRAFRRFADLRDREKFRGWLVRMTWRLALDHRRAAKRRVNREEAVAVPPLGDAEADAVARDRSARLWNAIDRLPEKLRVVTVLAAIEGHGVKEVAELTGAPGHRQVAPFDARKLLRDVAVTEANLVKPTVTRRFVPWRPGAAVGDASPDSRTRARSSAIVARGRRRAGSSAFALRLPPAWSCSGTGRSRHRSAAAPSSRRISRPRRFPPASPLPRAVVGHAHSARPLAVQPCASCARQRGRTTWLAAIDDGGSNIRTLEVLVPPDQEIAIRRLLLVARSGCRAPGRRPHDQKLPEAAHRLPIRYDFPVPETGGRR